MASKKRSAIEEPAQHRRGAIGWLEQVAAESSNPTARSAAKQDVSAWDQLVESWTRRGSQTRRSLADILAGIAAKEGDSTTAIKSGKREFLFHVWAEARERRGLPTLASAITGGLPMHKRAAQKGRWGRKLRT